MIARQPVRSSNVRSIGYDSAAQLLHVEFNGKDARMPGRVYEYEGVRPEQHQALVESPSIGTHFALHIKSRFRGRVVQNAGAAQEQEDVCRF